MARRIAKEEGISIEELDAIKGTGQEGRVTKSDILAYLPNRNKKSASDAGTASPIAGQGDSAQRLRNEGRRRSKPGRRIRRTLNKAVRSIGIKCHHRESPLIGPIFPHHVHQGRSALLATESDLH